MKTDLNPLDVDFFYLDPHQIFSLDTSKLITLDSFHQAS